MDHHCGEGLEETIRGSDYVYYVTLQVERADRIPISLPNQHVPKLFKPVEKRDQSMAIDWSTAKRFN